MADVTITGTLVNTVTGLPETGRGYIEPTVPVMADTGGNLTSVAGVAFTLDGTGSFSVIVPATDDPSLTPADFAYRLGLYLTGGTPRRLDDVVFAAPASVGTLDLADILPVGSALSPSQYTVLATRITALEEGGGVSDHGALTGLGDDDHPQYLTVARGDARYYTEPETDTLLADKAAVVHGHAQSDVTGLTAALAGKADSAHSHAQGDVTGLTAALAGKSDTSHTHDSRYYTESEVDALIASVASPGADLMRQGSLLFPAASNTSGIALTNAYSPVLPMVVRRSFNFTGAMIQCTTAVAATSVTFGLFADPTVSGANLVFAAPFATIGPFATTTTGTKTLTGLNITVPAGIVWIAAQSSGGTPSLSTPSGATFSLGPYAAPGMTRPDTNNPIISGATSVTTGGNLGIEAGRLPIIGFTGVTYP